MIRDLRIKSFKGIQEGWLSYPGWVNLITGLPGTGKTTLLELIYLLSNPWYIPHVMSTARLRGYYHRTDSSFNDYNLFLNLFCREDGEDQLGYHTINRTISVSGVNDTTNFRYDIAGNDMYEWSSGTEHSDINSIESSKKGNIIIQKVFQEEIIDYFYRYHNRVFSGKSLFWYDKHYNMGKERWEERSWECPIRLRSYEKYDYKYNADLQPAYYRAAYTGYDHDTKQSFNGSDKIAYNPTKGLYESEYVFFHDSVSEYTAFSRSLSKHDYKIILEFLQMFEPGIKDLALSIAPSGFTKNGIPLDSRVKVLPYVKHERFNIVPLYMFGDIINRAAFILLKIASMKNNSVLLIDDMDMLYNIDNLKAFTGAMLRLVSEHKVQIFMSSYNEVFFRKMFGLIYSDPENFKDSRLYVTSKNDEGDCVIKMQPTEVVVYNS